MPVTMKFLDGVTTDTNGGVFNVDLDTYSAVTVQIVPTTAATVNIQGRIPPITTWTTLNDSAITAAKAIDVKAMPEMRAISTGVNGALYVYGVASIGRASI